MKKGKELWNSVAEQYQSTLNTKDENGYPDELMAFLHRKGAVVKGERIADIGCGAGKYAVRFAEEGCNLLLIDIADQMLYYTKKNLEASNVKWTATECDFMDTDIEQMGWIKSVDLAFAAMTPAIGTEQDIEKMCGMSKKHCFVSRFARMDNPVRKYVCDSLGIPMQAWGIEGNTYLDLAGFVKKLGYLPEIVYADYEWENVMSIQETADKLFTGNYLIVDDTEENRNKVFSTVARIANEDGMVRELVKSKIAWLYWDVTQ